MVDGSAILATMPRLGMKSQVWGAERGTNMLDGGAPFYDTYETKDGKYTAVYANLSKSFGLPANMVSVVRLSHSSGLRFLRAWS